MIEGLFYHNEKCKRCELLIWGEGQSESEALEDFSHKMNFHFAEKHGKESGKKLKDGPKEETKAKRRKPMKSQKPKNEMSLEELVGHAVTAARKLSGCLERLTNQIVKDPKMVLQLSSAEALATKKANRKIVGLALIVAIFEERCELARRELGEKKKETGKGGEIN